MKTRTGFISNSSSSSFIIIGFDVDKKGIDRKENAEQMIQIAKTTNIAGEEANYDDEEFFYNLEEEKGIRIFSGGGDFGGPEGKIIIGKVLAELSDDDGGSFENESFPLLEEMKKLENIRNKVEGSSEIKIYLGTRVS